MVNIKELTEAKEPEIKEPKPQESNKTLSSFEIGTKIDELEKELREADGNLFAVDCEDIRLAKEILLLQIKRKENQSFFAKAKHNVRRINSELRVLRNKFWSAKNQGL